MIGSQGENLGDLYMAPRLGEEAEYEANAKLIASAPELLEALQRISKLYDHEKPSLEIAQLMYEAACIARAAIATSISN